MTATTRKNVPYGRLIQAAVDRYPVRNNAWSYHLEDNSFSAFVSDANDKDPWNRQLPLGQSEAFYHGVGEDREVGGWKVMTTVNGTHVELTIFND